MAAHAFLGVGQQSFRHQLRAKEGATNADVDDVGDRLFGVTAPQAVVNPADQLGHLVQDFMHLGHDIHAVHRQLVGNRAA